METKSGCNKKIKWQDDIVYRMGTQSGCKLKIIKIIITS